MSELHNFPMVNQLDLGDTTDGRPAENSQFDCVPASIAAGLQYFNGIHYSPDALKDSAYGEAWANEGTAATAFVPYCLSQGVKLSPVENKGTAAAVARAHQELAKGHPVIFTQQDDYAPGHPDWTHVCVWYKDTPGTLTAMDPYGGKSLTFDNQTWAARLRSSELWIMEKVSTMKFDSDGWLDAAIGIDATSKSMSREGHKPCIIVIHGTAGFQTAQDVGHYFASLDPNATNAASTHFVIGKDGAIVQDVPCSLAAWGNGGLTAGHKAFLPAGINPNLYTISIEHVKNHKNAAGQYDNMDTLTDAQKQASFELIDVLCKTFAIPRKVATSMEGGMLGHGDIDPVNRSGCPGPYPFTELVNFLKGTPNMGIFSNQTAVDLWNSQNAYFEALKQPLPNRDTKIFDSWIAEWKAGRFKGACLSLEFPITMQDGGKGIAQNYAGGTCTWYKSAAAWL